MQRWPAAPKALPMMLPTVLSITASGITTMKFLAPPSACTRFPFAAARSYTWLRHGGRPDERDGVDAGVVEDAVDDVPRAVDEVDNAVRQPAGSWIRLKISSCVSGTCSEGLRMNVLPHAIAKGRNQNGTMAGKLKGTMAAQTPTGWRNVSQSTAVATFSSTRPCIVWGIAEGRLDHLDRAADLGPRVGEGLAHLPRDRSRHLVLVRLQHLPEPEQPAGALDRRAAAPGGKAARAAATAASTSAAPDSGTRASDSPVAGLLTSRCSVPADGTQRPPM